jgi:hypothetical protein
MHGKTCDWKVYGLFGHMGKGVSVYGKEKLRSDKLFMPVAWEPREKPTSTKQSNKDERTG